MNWKFWQTDADDRNGRLDRPHRGAARRRLSRRVHRSRLVVGLRTRFVLRRRQCRRPTPQQKGVTVVTGYTTAATVARLAQTLLDKRGGYLSNDIFPPGVWLDNVPSWEFGVLVQIRDMSREMRLDFSRSQSQSAEDPDLSEAEGKFYWDNASWVFPGHRRRISQRHRSISNATCSGSPIRIIPTRSSMPRADNLRNWLAGVSTRLGSLSQRLSSAVGKRQLNTGLAGDSAAPPATRRPAKPK